MPTARWVKRTRAKERMTQWIILLHGVFNSPGSERTWACLMMLLAPSQIRLVALPSLSQLSLFDTHFRFPATG